MEYTGTQWRPNSCQSKGHVTVHRIILIFIFFYVSSREHAQCLPTTQNHTPKPASENACHGFCYLKNVHEEVRGIPLSEAKAAPNPTLRIHLDPNPKQQQQKKKQRKYSKRQKQSTQAHTHPQITEVEKGTTLNHCESELTWRHRTRKHAKTARCKSRHTLLIWVTTTTIILLQLLLSNPPQQCRAGGKAWTIRGRAIPCYCSTTLRYTRFQS